MIGTKEKGFTLIELAMVIAVLSILAVVGMQQLAGNVSSQRYEMTRQKMDKIRIAILGDGALDSQGRRKNYGYVGDFGGLPASLSNLTTAVSPAWTFSSADAAGAGWRGPYISDQDAGPEGVSNDKWGNAFAWSPSANPPTLTSYGSDGAAGGSQYAKDLVMTFPTSLWQATVKGLVTDGQNMISGKSVQLKYPSGGSLVTASTTTDSNGSFSFTGIPFSVTVLRVTGSPLLGPYRVPVDSSYILVPPNLLSYNDQSGQVTYTASSLSFTNSSATATVSLASSYTAAQTLSYFICFWAQSGYTPGWLRTISLNGASQSVAAQPGNIVGVATAMSIAGGAANVPFALTFYTTLNGSNLQNMSGFQFTCILDWISGNEDSITFP